MNDRLWNRRQAFLAGTAFGLAPWLGRAAESMIRRPIPASGESLPAIGLGTWQVFDVASTPELIEPRRDIVQLLIDKGGSLIDTSPMYNRAERVIGDVIRSGIDRKRLFLATKVWTDGEAAGREQIRRSAELMETADIDLVQVHNLRDLDTHFRTIRELQEQGLIRYNGITHYTAGALDELERAMSRYRPEFIQINYSLAERAADDRVLPLAKELGIAVLINRPFQSGSLFSAVRGKALPDWATTFADSWGQFFLKFIISHPSVTAAIPATSRPEHMLDNLGAGYGPLPDGDLRRRMIDLYRDL